MVKHLLETGISQIQAQQTSKTRKMNKMTQRHIIIKVFKIGNKNKVLKASRAESHIMYRETKIRIRDFSTVIMKERRQWRNIVKILKEKNRSTYNSISSENIFKHI